jgi:hypothetical protein
VIKSTNHDEIQILNDINTLFLGGNGFDCDPTYGRGKFYKGTFPMPCKVFDLFPRFDFVNQACATDLPISDNALNSMVFDPPFVAGHTKKPTGIIGGKYHGFPYMKDVWEFYAKSIEEHARVIKDGGIYVFKCQDSCSADRNWMSHVRVIALAEANGFYTRDLFILLAKNRLMGHNHKHIQKHARKFHSYFIVFEKMADGKTNKQKATI